ncbi:hypothetical protein MA5S0422_1969 [Mycobacteroides abscessus 5S-0422]|nr:hypothetical protein MA5S0304_0954 [Mycobacteroides abscessus 5S-0304]EIU15838.1 hypothetical protein MA5S0421_1234 [Mycobacteroides abscessus 5S-0421]EIU16469.1 hypothetical protein MA5S0422_1969 [Mycobacteroides abscessus 5S-0422]EIU28118.1 hypothetical protein MA5S0708_1459 [Mycobacteroides abscessus 5S-0708]EIU32394.1 hypothetical protein MA5S0817_1012 [Mycobacteroides abscessus 5S-0817]EIU32773.1 hypothetical protein MA5S1212_1403 [Mycobacteroides abscessus 5S-1212]EIU45993.1 hypothet
MFPKCIEANFSICQYPITTDTDPRNQRLVRNGDYAESGLGPASGASSSRQR